MSTTDQMCLAQPTGAVGPARRRTIWRKLGETGVVSIIDQRHLPHALCIEDIRSAEQMVTAIAEMHVRGAGLIGAAAAYGVYLAAVEATQQSAPRVADNRTAILEPIRAAAGRLEQARPTAVNASWAVARMLRRLEGASTHPSEVVELSLMEAEAIADEDAAMCRAIGNFGLPLIKALFERHQRPVNILTHCNAGRLAFVEYGTATAPIYRAQEAGLPVHVWVDETRPRNQGARLTMWELAERGVPATVIADNTGGHLMQQGLVDLVITGSDRTTRSGDVANKIGTYLKALAANDNDIPFYVALPSSSIDWSIEDGLKQIPIEQRDGDEVRRIRGLDGDVLREVLLTPSHAPAANYAFDVTPARLVSGLITERGIAPASEAGLRGLFPEQPVDKESS